VFPFQYSEILFAEALLNMSWRVYMLESQPLTFPVIRLSVLVIFFPIVILSHYCCGPPCSRRSHARPKNPSPPILLSSPINCERCNSKLRMEWKSSKGQTKAGHRCTLRLPGSAEILSHGSPGPTGILPTGCRSKDIKGTCRYSVVKNCKRLEYLDI